MKKLNRNRLITASCMAGLFLGFGIQAANAAKIDWGHDVWDHSAFGGTANNTGWDSAAQGVTGGTTVIGGHQVTVEVTTVGTAHARHSSFTNAGTPASGNYLVTSTTFNGADPVAKPALVFGMVNDYNASSFVNYGLLTLTFAHGVDIKSFNLGDIDTAFSSWDDLVAVEASRGGNNVGLTYDLVTPSGSAYQDFVNSTYKDRTFANGYLDGKTGDSNNAANTAEVGVTFNNEIDTISIYFFNGGSSGNQHGIYFRENTIEFAVPEPSTFALLGLGMLAAGVNNLRRRKMASPNKP